VALNTKQKRLSMMSWGATSASIPDPTGSFGVADRQQLLGSPSSPLWGVVDVIAGLLYITISNVS
jgi:hypothetical protein